MTDSTISTNLAQQAAQIQAITAACAAAIVGGFTSSAALGSPYFYPSALTDQQNLQDAVLDALLARNPDAWSISIWCKSQRDGVWEKVPHNIGQVKLLACDAIATRLALRRKKDDLIAQINDATTVEAVQMIVWTAT